jgi:hypothetical protein
MGIDRLTLFKDINEQKSSILQNNPGIDPVTVMDLASENVLFRTLTWHLNSLIKKYKATEKSERPASSQPKILRSSTLSEGGRRKRRSSRRRRTSHRRRRSSNKRH